MHTQPLYFSTKTERSTIREHNRGAESRFAGKA